MHPTFTKINWVCPTVSYNIHTIHEPNRIHYLDGIVFIYVHKYTDTNIHIITGHKCFHETSKHINMSKSQSDIFYDYNTLLTLYMFRK